MNTIYKFMKRVEANIRPEKLEQVLKAIKEIGVGGLMVRKIEGMGADDAPSLEFLVQRTIVTTIVEDGKVDDLMKSIADVATTGEKGDGKIYVENVIEMTDICTKEKETLDIPI